MFRIFTQLKRYLRENRLKYSLVFVGLILVNLLDLAVPEMVSFVIDQISNATLSLDAFLTAIGIFFSILVILYALNYLWGYLLFERSSYLLRLTRSRLMRKFFGLKPDFYAEHSGGSLLAKATSDVEAIGEFSGYGMLCLVDATLFPLTLMIYLFVRHPFFFVLASLIPFVMGVSFARFWAKRMELRYKAQQEAFDRLYEEVLENVLSVRSTRSYQIQALLRERFQEATKKLYETSLCYTRARAIVTSFTSFSSNLSTVVTLCYGIFLISFGQLTVGELVGTQIVLSMLRWPAMAFSDFVDLSKRAEASMKRVQEIMDDPSEFVTSEGALAFPAEATFNFKEFDFCYPLATSASLHGLTLSLVHGKSLGIVGKTGSGKSTLLKQFLNLYDLQGDSVLVNERPISTYRVETLRAAMSYVPQEPSLFSMTLRENLLLAHPEATELELEEAIFLSQLKREIDAFPNGLETLIGERGINLSGGQKQRVAIARALLKPSRYLLLDDCLSALDSQTEQALLQALRQRSTQQQLIVVAHRLSAVAQCDEILVLDEGKIVQRGRHEELIAQTGWYQEQYKRQTLEGNA